MKKNIKYWIIGGLAIVSISLTGIIFLNKDKMNAKDENLSNYSEDQDKIMADMTKNMKDIKITGDVSIDYLYGMIPHHESAIDMANSLLKYGGTNEDIKKIAQDVINVQTIEINDMKNLIIEMEKAPKVNKENEDAYLKEYNSMFGGTMSHDMVHPKTVDEAFAEGMIMHHEMAVDMSKMILKYSDNNKIKNMAQNIIDVQNKEIQVMKDILTTMK
ncbi:MAG: DUF305 domain-containing protein [Clostridium sp.]